MGTTKVGGIIVKNKVQKFGKFLSGMVMPNIGALIAFGFLAALFIDTGWIPNEKLNSMVSPMLTYLDLLAKICEVLEDEEVLEKMKTTFDLDWVMEQLS